MNEDKLRRSMQTALQRVEMLSPSPERVFALQRRRRRQHAAVTSVAALLIAAAVVVPLWLLLPIDDPQGTGQQGRSSPSTSAGSGTPESFETPPFLHVPDEYPMGSDSVMPLAFTDGTRIELIHPQSLPLASLGVRPYVSACGTDLSIVWGDAEGVLYKGSPVQTFQGSGSADGTRVQLFERAAHVPGYVLVFGFGSWTAGALFQHVDDPIISDCAAGLSGHEDADGFLRLDAAGPISVMERGHVGGPEIILGEAPPTSITLTAADCSPYEGNEVSKLNDYPVERYEGFAAWCVPEASVEISVSSKSEDLIDEVVASVELRRVD